MFEIPLTKKKVQACSSSFSSLALKELAHVPQMEMLQI